METQIAAKQRIVEQLHNFLQTRRRKWTGLQKFLDENQLTRSTFSLLRALEGETFPGQALTIEQMQEQLFNPYSTRFTIFEQLPLLVKQNYLQQQDETYHVTDMGRALITEIESAARIYMGSLNVPSVSLSELAKTLIELVHRSWQAVEPLYKAHQARTQRRPGYAGEPALVQIEWAVLGLWETRDDAHMAAWRATGLSGPVFDILTHIWHKKAKSFAELVDVLQETQWSADIEQGIDKLVRSNYLVITNQDGHANRPEAPLSGYSDKFIELTEQGRKVRDEIEVETDRLFFAPWDHLTETTILWIGDQLSRLCAYFRAHA